ncbi:MAG: extracellular solute-binding protein [Acidobacteriia bacterium]|nr:extracellular solute-binding protein [Terriglobia bacterium]
MHFLGASEGLESEMANASSELGFFIRPPEPGALNVALVAGPMYDPLYELLPTFEAKTGQRVHVAARLVQPELNAHLEEVYRSGQGVYDLISTHSQYAPAQKHFLRPLDDWFLPTELSEFIPSGLEMSRVEGWLLCVPRNIEVRLLHYRRDLFTDNAEQENYRALTGRELRVPETWEELAQVAKFFTRPPDLYGFAFPGRDSGLFETFFELVAMAGGKVFRPDLRPAFVDTAGRWALGFLRRLHSEDRVTPRELPLMRFDEVSNLFLEGRCAMVADWPGGFYRYQDPARSKVIGRFGLALYPTGPAGQRWVCAGGHCFGVPTSVRDEEGARALLKFLTAADAQWHEARHGAVPVLKSVQNRLKAETDAGTLEGQRLALLGQTMSSHMLLPPRFPLYPAVEEALRISLQKGLTGEWSVEDALHRAAAEMQKVLGS